MSPRLTGGEVTDPRTGATIRWRPVGPVADEWRYYMLHRTVGWTCLGVIGDRRHLRADPPQDHTPYSASCIGDRCPLRGWVYAIDGRVPDQGRFAPWLLGRVRAGHYPHVKYFNVNRRHWSRAAVRGGRPFAYAASSPDDHFHLSVMPGYEYARSTILADWAHYRAHGRNVSRPVPRPRPFDLARVHAAARALPTLRPGATGRAVALLQGMLLAAGHTVEVDSRYGSGAQAAVRAFQRARRLAADGVVGRQVWDALVPDRLRTVIRGMVGQDVAVMAGLLRGWGYVIPVDRRADEAMIASLKRFQVIRRVAGSVVNGRGDGIGGPRTWVALLTP